MGFYERLFSAQFLPDQSRLLFSFCCIHHLLLSSNICSLAKFILSSHILKITSLILNFVKWINIIMTYEDTFCKWLDVIMTSEEVENGLS